MNENKIMARDRKETESYSHYTSEIEKIRDVLEKNPRGLTNNDIADLIGVNRNTVAKYLDVMHALGLVELKKYGPAKVWFLSERIPLTSLFNYTSSGVMVLDGNLVVHRVNKAQADFLGKTEGEVVDRNVSEVDDMWGLSIKGETAAGIYKNALEGKSYEALEVPVKSRTGGLRYFDLKVYPVILSGGKRAIVVIRDDTTERKRAEEMLREAEARYQALFEHSFERSPDGILIIDTETTMATKFNDAAHRNLGYTRDEFSGLRVMDYEAREKPEETKMHIEKVLREGQDTFVTKHRTRDGKIRDVLVTAQKIEISGRPVLNCIYRDITGLNYSDDKPMATKHE